MSGKRANKEGSIYYRRGDGRWVGSLTLEGGGRKHFYGKTREEAHEKLAGALGNRQQGLPILSERQTVAKYLEDWLQTVQPSLRPRTFVRYQQYLRLHAIPYIGKVILARLTPQHLQRLYSNRLDAGLSPTSVAHLHAVLHKAIQQAANWSLVGRNVADLVTPPRVQRKEMNAFDPDQARGLLEAARGHRLEALYVVALSTGMRQGELLALRWRDVNLDGGTLQVRATLQRSKQGYEFAEPKTARSRRQVSLSATAVAALRRHRTGQAEERLKAGAAWQDGDLVFCNRTGGFLDGRELTRGDFYPLLARAGLPRIRFHDLRHTAATLLLGQGVHPKIVSDMLGHATIAVTLDLYSHTTPAMHKQAALVLDAILSR